MGKRKFNRSRCTTMVRTETQIDVFGMKITLVGKHAYEWEVVIEEENNIKIISFSSRRQARSEFNKRLGKQK